MVYCCAINCNNRLSAELRKTKGITFHRFPDAAKDGERRKRWIANLRRDKFNPNNKRVWICSQHFLQKMFDRTGQTTRLKPDAVPTLFDFPPHIQKHERQRRSPRKRSIPETHPSEMQQAPADDNTDSTENCGLNPHPKASQAATSHDHAYHVSETPRKIKRKLEVVLERNAKLAQKLKLEQTKKCKLRKTVSSLKAVIKELRDKNLVTSQCADILDSTFSGVPNDLMQRLLKKNDKRKTVITETKIKMALAERAVVLVVCFTLLAGVEGFEKRNEVDIDVDSAGAPPTRESLEKALKNAQHVVQEAIRKVEDPAAFMVGDEIELPVRDAAEEKMEESLKPKRRGMVRVRVGKK